MGEHIEHLNNMEERCDEIISICDDMKKHCDNIEKNCDDILKKCGENMVNILILAEKSTADELIAKAMSGDIDSIKEIQRIITEE